MPDVSEGLRQEGRMWTAFLPPELLVLLLFTFPSVVTAPKLLIWRSHPLCLHRDGRRNRRGWRELSLEFFMWIVFCDTKKTFSFQFFFISINCAAPHGRDLNTQVSVMMILFWMQTLISKKSSNLPVDSYSQTWGGINIWSVACCFRMKSAYDLVKQLIWASWKSWKRK